MVEAQTREKNFGGNEMKGNILRLEHANIGPTVYAGEVGESILSDITAICRRKFKKEDVCVFVDLDEEEEYETGVVFTDDSIIYWTETSGDVEKIPYKSISAVDVDEDSVFIKHGNANTNIALGDEAEDEKYPRYMYTFIMDILDLMGVHSEEVIENCDFGSSILKEAEALVGAYSKGSNMTKNIIKSIVGEISEGRNNSVSSEEIALGVLKRIKEITGGQWNE